MCGICGIMSFNMSSAVQLEDIKNMENAIHHRGPDDHGQYLNEKRYIGLGFRRLSIIDIKSGAQPMTNMNGDIHLVFNGEIYNHKSLRQILLNRGHTFKTSSDTESILNGYAEWGFKVVNHLRGMFSFGIWDSKKNLLFLARDRLGIKPLYYYSKNGKFAFSSEIKSLLSLRYIKKEINEESLFHYLSLAASPSPETMFRNINKLEPGHTLIVKANGDIQKKQYWCPAINREIVKHSEMEIIEKLRILLEESVKMRMMSDVPYGAFLSGGIDSSLNTALMSKLSKEQVNTFTVAISDDPLSNELSEAKYVSNYFCTNHHEVSISKQDFINFLPTLARQQDEPLSDPVSIPLYYVSELANRSNTPVILVGEGADEIFSGYGLYNMLSNFNNRFYKPFSNLPSTIKNISYNLAKFLLPERKLNYVENATLNRELFWGGSVVFSEKEKNRLLRNTANYNTYEKIIEPIYAKMDEINLQSSFIDRAINLELNHRLPELLLMRIDKMAMSVSVETRVPFLDHKLVEFALGIPYKYKYRNGSGKFILKQAARGIIPDKIIDRKKYGFCGSSTNIISGSVIDYAEMIIMESEWVKNYFNLSKIRPLFSQHRNSEFDHGVKIFSLLNLSLWQNEWFN